MTPRGIRNNNPGNIRSKPGTVWVGSVGVDDLGFVRFDSEENGIRALARVLMNYQAMHGLKTLRKMISRWAPSIENDTEAYVESVCKACNASPDSPYTLTPARTRDLVKAIIKHENGLQPYDEATITTGVDRAFT
jgi:hypothetical protein